MLAASRGALVLALFACGAAAAPCEGVSPNGTRWLFVMPQHTGTGAVVALLRELRRPVHCLHVHSRVELRDVTPRGFVFMFAADPLKRAVSAATGEASRRVMVAEARKKTTMVLNLMKTNSRVWMLN